MELNSLKQHLCKDINVCFLQNVDSTNDYLKKASADLVIAKNQSKGKGRYQNSYFSYDGGLYFSLKITDFFSKEALTIIMALAVYDALNKFGIKTQLKWLNDILKNQYKVVGILCENSYLGHKYECSIIGVGINLYYNEKYYYIFDDKINEELFLATIINNFFELLNDTTYLERYKKVIGIEGKMISYQGKFYLIEKINNDGSLLVSKDNQKLILDYSAQKTRVLYDNE